MPSVRAATGIVGTNPEYLGAATDSSIVYDTSNYDETNHSAQIGMAATFVSGAAVGAAEAGLGAAEAVFAGVIDRVEGDGTCALQVKGGMSCAYNTTYAPVVGGSITADGTGKVRAPSAATGRGVVVSLDTVNHIAYFYCY